MERKIITNLGATGNVALKLTFKSQRERIRWLTRVVPPAGAKAPKRVW